MKNKLKFIKKIALSCKAIFLEMRFEMFKTIVTSLIYVVVWGLVIVSLVLTNMLLYMMEFNLI